MAVEEIEGTTHVFHNRLKTAGAHELHFRLDFAGNPNLAVEQLRGGIDLQRLDLLDLCGLVVDAARSIVFPDGQLTDGQVLNIKEHVYSASGAHAHAFLIIESLARQVKERAGVPCS